MIEMTNYKGFLVMNTNDQQFHVYEPIALAYLDGKNFPPEEFHLAELETQQEAQDYIDNSLEATHRAIEADRRKIYGENYDKN